MQFRLPELGEGVHEGEMVKWKVKVGESIKFDQPLCEIMTDKATVEIPSAIQGKVQELHVKEGEVVKVGQLMLSLEGAVSVSASSPSSSPSSAASHQTGSTQRTELPMQSSPAISSSPLAPLAAPSTRRMARELGIDLKQIRGSGPHGRIMKDDLGREKSPQAPARVGFTPRPAAGEERVPLRGLRKKIAEKMRLSKDKAAHFTYVEEADVTQLVKLRTQAKEIAAKQGVKLTYLPFVMKAMVAALRQYPVLNATLDEARGEIVYKYQYNIGLSIQTDEGLTAPVIHDVANKSVLEIARDIQDVVERARNKKLNLEDFQGSTITLTNAGSIGGLFATPVINFPEVAILGFNKIFRKPVVRVRQGKEKIVIRDWTYFSISLDHRIVDGAIGAEFMKLFVHYIENPSLLLLESF